MDAIVFISLKVLGKNPSRGFVCVVGEKIKFSSLTSGKGPTQIAWEFTAPSIPPEIFTPLYAVFCFILFLSLSYFILAIEQTGMLVQGLDNPIIKRLCMHSCISGKCRCCFAPLFIARPMVGDSRPYNRVCPKAARSFLIMICQIPDRQIPLTVFFIAIRKKGN